VNVAPELVKKLPKSKSNALFSSYPTANKKPVNSFFVDSQVWRRQVKL